MPKNHKKEKAKEKGLKPLEKTDFRRKSDLDLKPRFTLHPLENTQSASGIFLPFIASDERTYTDHFLSYLNAMYQKLREDVPRRALTFDVSEEAVDEFRRVSANMDVYVPVHPDSSVLNASDLFRDIRGRALSFATTHSDAVLYIISTHRNTEQREGKPALLRNLSYRPVCNNVVSAGSIFGVNRVNDDRFHMSWEAYDMTDDFTRYLERVHEILTGSTYLSEYRGVVPLYIHTAGVNAPESEKRTMDELIDELSREFEGRTVDAKYVHANGREIEGKMFINHMDGAIRKYGFNQLRGRLYNWKIRNGVEQDADDCYRKVFLIEVDGAAKDEGYILPIYSSFENANELDMHDLVDVFMGRFML